MRLQAFFIFHSEKWVWASARFEAFGREPGVRRLAKCDAGSSRTGGFFRRGGTFLRWAAVLHLHFSALPARRRNVGFSCCAAHTPRSLPGKLHTAATRASRRRTVPAAKGCKDANRSRCYPLTLLLRQAPEPLVGAALRKNAEISLCDFQRPL